MSCGRLDVRVYTSYYKHHHTQTMIPYLRRMHACRQASTRPPAKSCQSQNHGKAQCGNRQKLRQGRTPTPPPQLIKPEPGTKPHLAGHQHWLLSHAATAQGGVQSCRPTDSRRAQTLVNSTRPLNHPALRAVRHASVVQAAQQCRNTRCKSHSDGDKTGTPKGDRPPPGRKERMQDRPRPRLATARCSRREAGGLLSWGFSVSV